MKGRTTFQPCCILTQTNGINIAIKKSRLWLTGISVRALHLWQVVTPQFTEQLE